MENEKLEWLKKDIDEMKKTIEKLEYKVYSLETVPVKHEGELKTSKEVFCDDC